MKFRGFMIENGMRLTRHDGLQARAARDMPRWTKSSRKRDNGLN
jgi:hypothetical protein